MVQDDQLKCDLTWAISAQTLGDTLLLRVFLNEINILANLPNTLHLFKHGWASPQNRGTKRLACHSDPFLPPPIQTETLPSLGSQAAGFIRELHHDIFCESSAC